MPRGNAKNKILLSAATLSIMAAVNQRDLLLRRSLLGMAQRWRKRVWSSRPGLLSATSYVRLPAQASSIQSFSSGSPTEFSTDAMASITACLPRLALASYTSTKASAAIPLRTAVEMPRALSIFKFLLPSSCRTFIPTCDPSGPKGARAAKTG
jgi:hypothetical protein